MKLSLPDFLTPSSSYEPPATVRTRREGPVLHVELYAPETGNAVTEAMLDELLEAVTA
ncbi:enoyl-CoA hydratase/isomerase family protein, partial [Streptomyces sp. SID2119]|nr:enoyl-CoA hydratase/isomerase family protein [Streptomyces sp. SID2119]